jgi:hypothetical protein
VTVAPPPNDDCSTPIAIGPGRQRLRQRRRDHGAQGQVEALCNSRRSTAVNKDMWYLYTPTQTTTVTVTTCGCIAEPDAGLEDRRLRGPACPANGTPSRATTMRLQLARRR